MYPYRHVVQRARQRTRSTLATHPTCVSSSTSASRCYSSSSRRPSWPSRCARTCSTPSCASCCPPSAPRTSSSCSSTSQSSTRYAGRRSHFWTLILGYFVSYGNFGCMRSLAQDFCSVFCTRLWTLVCDQSLQIQLRQNASRFLVSFLSRAAFVSHGFAELIEVLTL